MRAQHPSPGFTLIELMIVIVILGILAAIAVPNYLTYVNRAKVAEGLVLARPAQVAVAEWIVTHGNADVMDGNQPTYNTLLGLPASISGKYVSSITVTGGGWVNVAFDPSQVPGTNPTLLLVPVITLDNNNMINSNITWLCGYLSDGSHAIDPSYLPSNCRTANPLPP